jgi:sulfate permease, SulP family
MMNRVDSKSQTLAFGSWLEVLPVVQLFRGYRHAWFRADLLAGISVCVVMIPSVIAYAELAGLPPISGLYASLAAIIGYAIFASSRQVIAGPDAAVTLLVGIGITPFLQDHPERAPALAAMVALLGGGLMFVASGLKAGMIADFLSKPVLVGYLTGAALILMSTQFGKLFGIKLDGHNFFALVSDLFRHIRETNMLTLGIGIGLILLLEVLRRWAPKIPGALIVFVLALIGSAVFRLQDCGVAVIGEVPRGLPLPRVPIVSFDVITDLLPAAVGIALLTFPEGVLLARAFAAKNNYSIRPNQELLALSAANLAAGFFQGFSVGASQSRTTVNDAAGGKTQMSGFVAAGALVLFLIFFTGLLKQLPVVTLAAILIFSGIHLVEIHAYRNLYKIMPRSFFLALIVTAGVLVVGVIPGILIGVMISLVVLLGKLARPTDALLREVPSTGAFHDTGDAPEAKVVPGLIAYRFYAPLFFANADYFTGRVNELIAANAEPVRWFVVDMQAVTDIDVTAAEALDRLHADLKQRGIALKFARANRPLRERLARIGLGGHLGEQDLFPSVHATVAAFRKVASEKNPPGTKGLV